MLFSVAGVALILLLSAAKTTAKPAQSATANLSADISPRSKPAFGNECLSTRGWLCHYCLSGTRTQSCSVALGQGLKRLGLLRRFGIQPFPKNIYDPIAYASRMVPDNRAVQCGGFISLLISKKACTFPSMSKEALRAVAFAHAANMKFRPRDTKKGKFEAMRNANGYWVIVYKPKYFYNNPNPGTPTTPHVSGNEMNGFWDWLIRNGFGGHCPNPQEVTTMENGKWTTKIVC